MRRGRTLEEREFGRPRRPMFQHPGQALVAAFAAAVAVGTVLLLLPWSRSGPGSATFLEALFTSTNAVCVTGFSAVDVATFWSPFGQGVILALVQVGGFGVMALATLLGLVVSRRMGLRTRLTAATESNTLGIGEVREVLFGVFKVSLVIEAAVTVAVALRFALGYDEPPLRALWLGLFHAVTSFNHAGFALWPDSLARFVGDPWIIVPLCLAVLLGSVGFPVLFELRKQFRRPSRWTLHTKMTLWGSLVLLVGGFVFLTASEWNNPDTLAGRDVGTRLLAGFTQSVMPRSAGLQSLDYADMTDPSVFVTTILMFIGGGSASTAGGIKVTTFFLLLFVIMAEVRGQPDVEAGDRRVDARAQRQALSVALLSVALVILGALLLMEIAALDLQEALFESTSAFSTTGLSLVGTGNLPDAAHVVLIALMFIGRVGPITLVSALALRERQPRYRLPEGRPLIG